jgi:hypothetical protein
MLFGSKKVVRIFVLGAPFATILFAFGRYGSQFVLYFKIRHALPYVDSDGKLGATPQPLNETAASTGKGTTLSYFDCRFEVPWQEVVLEQKEGRWVDVQFKTGQAVRIFNPEELYAHDDLIARRVAGTSSIWEMALKEGFPKSKYEQFKAVVSVTPAQLSPFQTKSQFARTLVLIYQKQAYFEHNPFKPEIFSFEKPGFRGFEVSGILQNMEEAILTIFDAKDKMFRVSIRGDCGLNARLSQSEIDRVIDSFSIQNEPPTGAPQKQ